jgi:hypothetical protein
LYDWRIMTQEGAQSQKPQPLEFLDFSFENPSRIKESRPRAKSFSDLAIQ